MITVNELIHQAYTRIGVVGEGMTPNGTRAKSALHELNVLIQELNQQEYISDNLKIFDVSKSSKITIGPSIDFDIQVDRAPTHIKSVSRKIGDRYVNLVPSNIEAINASCSKHLATQFTYMVDWDSEARVNPHAKSNVFVVDYSSQLPECTEEYCAGDYKWYATATNTWGFAMGTQGTYVWAAYSGSPTEEQLENLIYDYDNGCMKGTVVLDSSVTNKYKVIFMDEIPEYSLGDPIRLQDMYKGLLLAGLTYRLAVRHKLQDWVSAYKDDFDEQKSLIKRINHTNRNIVWNQAGGSYMDDYYNGMTGGNW